MTIANENNRIQLTATGGQTVFVYNFEIEDEDEITVYLTPNGSDPDDTADLLILTTDYTVTNVGLPSGGTIVLTSASFPTGATAGDILTAVRNIKFDQQDEYFVGRDNAEITEDSLDRMTMRIQRLEEIVSRALKQQASENNNNSPIIPAMVADHVLACNGAGDGFDFIPTSSAVANIASLVAIADAGNYYTAANVEDALQELQYKGTFLMQVRGGTVAGTGWAQSANGLTYYIKIGKLAFFHIATAITTVGAGASGDLQMFGFPTNVDIVSLNMVSPVSVDSGLNLSPGYTWVTGRFSNFGASTTFILKEHGDNVASQTIQCSQITAPFTFSAECIAILP